MLAGIVNKHCGRIKPGPINAEIRSEEEIMGGNPHSQATEAGTECKLGISGEVG